jgi:hypothetical protein
MQHIFGQIQAKLLPFSVGFGLIYGLSGIYYHSTVSDDAIHEAGILTFLWHPLPAISLYAYWVC